MDKRNNKEKNTAVLLARNLVWAAVIFTLCAMPGESIPDPQLDIPHLDKIVHFGLFFIMAILLCNEMEYQTSFSLKKTYIISIFVVAIYGGLIEILQATFFNRSGDWFDFLADVAGGVAGCFCYPLAKQLKHRIFKKGK